jgi:hypothetical protein
MTFKQGVSRKQREWRMSIDDLLRALTTRPLTVADIETYCAQSNLPLTVALDAAAKTVARRYLSGELTYTAGDMVMNLLFGFVCRRVVAEDGFEIPRFMNAVFLAFDAGEFYPDSIRSPTPEERFTRPQIEALLGKDGDA